MLAGMRVSGAGVWVECVLVAIGGFKSFKFFDT